MDRGGMQLLPKYHAQLRDAFLKWYEKVFTSTRMIYLHWPVECTDVDDPHYNVVVGMLSGTHTVKVWRNFDDDPGDATFGRNTNSMAISLAGFAGAGTSDLGPNCASPEEVDGFVSEVALQCTDGHIPVGNVESHGEAADNVDQAPDPSKRSIAAGVSYNAPWMSGADATPYGPLSTYERWDLHMWIDPVTRKLYAPVGPPLPDSYEYFPDYVRGQAILKIQEQTKSKWA